MIVKVTKADIVSALKKLQAAVVSNPTAPIYGAVCVCAREGGNLLMRATDTNIHIECGCAVQEVVEGGEVCIPARMLTTICEKMPDGTISIRTEDAVVKVESGKVRYRVPAVSGEFPQVQVPEDREVSFTAKAAMVRDILRKAVRDVSRDNSRMALTGVLMEVSGGKLLAVGTDGKAMSIVRGEAQYEGAQAQAVLPSRAVNELVRLIGGDGDIEVVVSGGAAFFQFDGMLFRTTIMEQGYPNFRQVVPSMDGRVAIHANRDEFVSCVERVAIMSSADNSHVVINIGDNAISVRSPDTQFGTAVDEFAVKHSGKTCTVALSHERLISHLKNVDAEDVSIIVDEDAAGTTPLIVRDRTSGYFGLIMPIRQM